MVKRIAIRVARSIASFAILFLATLGALSFGIVSLGMAPSTAMLAALALVMALYAIAIFGAP